MKSMSSSDYHDSSNNNSCLSLNSIDSKRSPISSQLSCQDYIHFSAPGLKKSKRTKGKSESPEPDMCDESEWYQLMRSAVNEMMCGRGYQ